MAEHDYTEIRIHPDAMDQVSLSDWLGQQVLEQLVAKGKPVVVYFTDDLENGKPWANDNKTNRNRRGIGQ